MGDLKRASYNFEQEIFFTQLFQDIQDISYAENETHKTEKCYNWFFAPLLIPRIPSPDSRGWMQLVRPGCEENLQGYPSQWPGAGAGSSQLVLWALICKVIVKPKSKVQSPKVKTQRTWADTIITRLLDTFFFFSLSAERVAKLYLVTKYKEVNPIEVF